MQLSKVIKNDNPFSASEYKYMKTRSDGRLPDRQKPASKGDKVIHESHILDSGQYNTRHAHDHTAEFVFDIKRFNKEGKKQLSDVLKNQYKSVLNKQLSKIGLKVS